MYIHCSNKGMRPAWEHNYYKFIRDYYLVTVILHLFTQFLHSIYSGEFSIIRISIDVVDVDLYVITIENWV